MEKKETGTVKYETSKGNKTKAIAEELGLNIYLDSTEGVKTPEVRPLEQREVSPFNDIDISQWKDYPQIITDSLWLIGSRDKSSVHTAELHGNFIPQIPHQGMLRYTKPGDIVLDTFLGSGTTLIECKRLGRNGIGIELLPNLAQMSRDLLSQAPNPCQVHTEVVEGDSCLPETFNRVKEILRLRFTAEKVQLIIMHPPYHDIIKFSTDSRDLCNAPTIEAFLERLAFVLKNSYPLLEDKRFLILVIGDKYSRGEWVPLGFYTMQKVIQSGYKLKSIVVKNIVGNRAKRNLEHFWRRRALKGGYYIFKHEYIMFFQKETSFVVDKPYR